MLKSLGMNTMQKSKTHQLGIYATRRIQELCCPTQQNFRKACYRRSAGSNGRLSAQTRQHRTHQNLYYHMYKYAMANNLCTKDYSSYVEITQDENTWSAPA